jgi:hypothetical protein
VAEAAGLKAAAMNVGESLLYAMPAEAFAA